ncbi:hypothetical protein [Rhodoplanes serenus]|uniref:hypothetical protein n=1 Tax=Rhodoplanes serenus TaxID=200615 RepID=UPI000DBC16E5|nr:hypothetical protein [Rhodoplanes serenus]RAI31555.1 hypothetical protein CH340_18275 [Rhodoplanes serenus]
MVPCLGADATIRGASRGAALAAALLLSATVASAQGFPGVMPPTPSPGGPILGGSSLGGPSPGSSPPLGGPPPPAIAPGPAAPGGGIGADRRAVSPAPHGGRVVVVPGLPPVVVPPARRGRDSYADSVERCVHYGSAAGVPPSEIGRFSAMCAHAAD